MFRSKRTVLIQINNCLPEFEAFPASPPAQEDSFFIRYPKPEAVFGRTHSEQTIRGTDPKPGPILAGVTDKDWSKHTKPCQDVMHGIAPINTAVNSVKPKPAGTDDGFKGEGAACGTSMLKVAHEMISSSSRSVSQRGFTVATPVTEDQEPRYNTPGRRGSKSLPTTPAHTPPSSPGSRRKYANRYFTSPYEASEDGTNTRSWLTMALLGFKKDFTTSTSTLAEEDALQIRLQEGSLAESVENLGPSPRAKEELLQPSEAATQNPKLVKPAHTFRPKPSELREMNFWSPTSM